MKPSDVQFHFLNDEEVRRLSLLRIYAAEKNRATTEQILETLNWAEAARISNALVDTVLNGEAMPMGCKVPGDLDTMQVQITPKGTARAVELVKLVGMKVPR